MKNRFFKPAHAGLFLTTFLTTFFLVASAARAESENAKDHFDLLGDLDALGAEVLAPVQNVFVPQGFDSNDNAEIVIAGVFPNSCWKMGKTTHTFDPTEKKIHVKVAAFKIKSDYCLTMTVPFMQVVQLGALEPAKYPITVNGNINTEIPIDFAPAQNRDDHLYASVYGLIQRDPTNRPTLFEMQGSLPNECYEIVKVKVNEESERVVTVLPIMQKIDGCSAAQGANPKAFIQQFEVPATLKGKVLIHVRVLNGGSVNQVVDLR